MPLMIPVLMFGPPFLVVHTGNLIAMVAAAILGMGLVVLWLCMMCIAQRLDALAPGSAPETQLGTDVGQADATS